MGRRGSGSTRYSEELAVRAAGNTVLLKGMTTSTGQYTPVFLPGESQGQRSLVDCRLWGCTESDTTEAT